MNITSIISTLLAFTVANKGFWQLCEYKTPPYHTRKIVRWKAMSNCNWLLNTILFVICVCLYFSELALRQSWPFHYIQQRVSFTFYAIHHEENSWTILIVLMTAVFCLRVLELLLAMQSDFSPPWVGVFTLIFKRQTTTNFCNFIINLRASLALLLPHLTRR